MSDKSDAEKGNREDKKRGKYWLPERIILILMILVILILLLIIIVFVLSLRGRNSLQNNVVSALPSEQSDEEADVDNGTSDDYYWEDDWIIYNGKVYDYNDDILTFLFMGIDIDDEVENVESELISGQADAVFLLVLDSYSQKISVIAIDRNTMTEMRIYSQDGEVSGTTTAQLCLAHSFGITEEQGAENTILAVSQLMYNIPIHGYCTITLPAIALINDVIGGVDLVVLEDLTLENPLMEEGALVHLEGMDAYTYVKYRNIEIEGSARSRLQRQKQYLFEYIEKAKAEFRQDITLPIKMYNTIIPYMNTDLTLDEIIYLATIAGDYTFSEDDMIVIPGTTDMSTGYDRFYPDEDELRKMIINTFYVLVENVEIQEEED